MTTRLSLLAAIITSATMAFATSAFAKTTLTVYTAPEADQVKAYQDVFEKANPDIKIKWVRDSTGVVTAKLLAEKNNPCADVVWGLAASSLATLDEEGMLTPHTPVDLAKVGATYHDKANPSAWMSMDAWGAAICFNTVEVQKQNLPKPTSWADLIKPVYAGKIVMSNPASPDTSYLDVSAWLQMMGEQKGWAYMDTLHQNISQYMHLGSKPCKMTASDEFPVGIAFKYRVVKSKKEGAPIDIVLSSGGLGWDAGATDIMKGAKNLEAVKKLADLSASPAAMALYEKNFAVVATPGFSKPDPLLPADYKKRLIKNDFTWASVNRDRILVRWTKRYDGKLEKK